MKPTFEELLQYAPLPRREPELPRELRARIVKKTLDRLPEPTPNPRRFPVRRVLIAAAILALLALTAGAVGFGLHQAARSNLGITEPERIPGYTEYELNESPVPFEPREDPLIPGRILGGPVELVSVLSSGDKLTAFVRVPGVTEEMESYSGELWDGDWMYAKSGRVEQVSYDPETQTALVKVWISGFSERMKSIPFTLVYQTTRLDAPRFRYDQIELPVTPTVCCRAEIHRIVTHPDLESFKAELLFVEVFPMQICLTIQTPTLNELLVAVGEDYRTSLGNVIYGEPAEESMTGRDLYDDLLWMLTNPVEHTTKDPNSPSSPGYVMEGATLNFADGSMIDIAALERITAGDWLQTDWGYGHRTGVWRFDATLSKTLDLSGLESVTVGGVSYPLTRQEQP